MSRIAMILGLLAFGAVVSTYGSHGDGHSSGGSGYVGIIGKYGGGIKYSYGGGGKYSGSGIGGGNAYGGGKLSSGGYGGGGYSNDKYGGEGYGGGKHSSGGYGDNKYGGEGYGGGKYSSGGYGDNKYGGEGYGGGYDSYGPDKANYYYDLYNYDPYYYKNAALYFKRYPGGAAFDLKEDGKGSNVDVNVETYKSGSKY